MSVRTSLVLLALAVAGCNVERHFISAPGTSQVLQAESGDRFFMDLEENMTTGYRWEATCDDSDVEVTIDHVPSPADANLVGAAGKAEVTIRVHRGYDGPSAVVFAYRRLWEQKPAKTFTISLFKRTGDAAFWK